MHVKVLQRGPGILALDNEDGTWNIEFDDGTDGDVPLGDIETAEETPPSNEHANGIRMVAPPWTEPKLEGWTRFVCFSDTHGLHGQIPKKHLPAADVLLHAGDFTNTGELEQVESFSSWLEAYPAAHKVVIAGNHDITFDEYYYTCRGALRFHPRREYDCTKARGLLTGCTYLQDSAIEVGGYRIYGSPWQPAFCDWAFNLERGVECRKQWTMIPSDVDILITHGPAAGHGDRCSSGIRAGCEDLLTEIQSRSILVAVAGHIHEGYGMSSDGVTLYLNASTCTHSYRPTNPPIVFDAPPVAMLREATVSAATAAGLRPPS